MLTSAILAALLLGQVPDGRYQNSGQQPTVAPPFVPPPAVQTNAPAVSAPGVNNTNVVESKNEQAPAIKFRETPARSSTEERPLAPVPPLVRTEAAAELLEEALTLPPQSTATGRNWTLMEVLARVPDRPRQIAVAEMYWKLSSAVAEYRVGWDEFHQIDQLQPRGANQAGQEAALLLETVRSSAKSRLGDAELAVSTAQFELAEALQLSATEPLPLPADAPHVGSYKTYFQEIYATRAPSARVRWIDFALPLQLRAITARATAVRAAFDAADATHEAYNQGQVELVTLLSSITELARLRRTFLSVVREYNRDIAAYALTTAPPGLDQNRLVGMLIKSGRSNPANLTPLQSPRTVPASADVQPATFTDPAPARPVQQPVPSQQPTPAQPPVIRAPAEPDPFIPNPPMRAISPERAPQNEGNPLNGGNAPTSAPPANAAPASVPAASSNGMAPPFSPPTQGNPLRAKKVEAKRPPENDGAAATYLGTIPPQPVVADTGLYGGLSALPPNRRLEELAGALHWDRGLPESQGAPISLSDCLNSPLVIDRPGTIAAYWLTRHQAAVYRAQKERVEHLESLLPVSVTSREQPGGPEAVLRARRAKLAADADLLQSQLELDAAQYALTQLAGRSLEFKWLLPSTSPLAQSYLLPQIPATSTGSEGRRLRQLATAIPTEYGILIDRAESVVSADMARASVLSRDHTRPENVDASLAAIEHQNEATVAFLLALTRYNNDIAEFVLRTSPAKIPADDLARTLTMAQK